MATQIDFTGSAPMQWVFDIDPTKLDVSQRLPIKHGGRNVDGVDYAVLEPGVYTFIWETNMPKGQWKSFYLRDVSYFEGIFVSFGSRETYGSRRIVLPGKTNLYCYSAIDTQLSTPDPVISVSLVPDAPLANAFET